jgi:hypothetical protein
MLTEIQTQEPPALASTAGAPRFRFKFSSVCGIQAQEPREPAALASPGVAFKRGSTVCVCVCVCVMMMMMSYKVQRGGASTSLCVRKERLSHELL